MDKKVLRERYMAIRFAMKQVEIEAKSQMICQKLLDETAWELMKTVLVYKPIAKLNEVELSPFLDNIKGVEIDILDSSKAQPLPDKKYDLIIVPTLAFDKNNYRLGWGGGFYDRLLAKQPQALKVGLCFQSGFVSEGLLHEPHDIPLDKIITEV